MFRSALPDLDLDLPYAPRANLVLDGAPERVLLLNPPAIDLRLPWAQWIQPTALLRAGSYLKARGADVRYLNCLAPIAGKRLSKSLYDRVSVDRIVVNRWRYGKPARQFAQDLKDLALAGWQPDLVLIEGLAAHWWPGVSEVSRTVRKQFSDVSLVLFGTYPFLARAHAEHETEASFALDAIPSRLLGQSIDVALQAESSEIHYLWLDNPFGSVAQSLDEISARARMRKPALFAIADPSVAGDDRESETFEIFLVLQRHIER